MITTRGTGVQVPMAMLLTVGGGCLLILHAVRASRVTPETAQVWLKQRNLPQDQRTALAVEAYLRRLRWSRVGSTALLIAACAASLFASSAWISFVSLPFLLSVLAAETLAPDPRRARVRVATLVRRPRSYFAPPLALLASRAAIASGVVLSLLGAAVADAPAMATSAAVHGGVLLVGLVALELCLHRTAGRAMPDRQPDVAVDTAMRVASSRAATAAALVFGTYGLFFALGAAGVGDVLGRTASVAVGQVLTLAMLTAFAVAVNLVQPLSSWAPKEGK